MFRNRLSLLGHSGACWHGWMSLRGGDLAVAGCGWGGWRGGWGSFCLWEGLQFGIGALV